MKSLKSFFFGDENKISAGEELSEKSTTKFGYFLLVCMFLASITSAQWSLGIIKDIPDRPNIIPGCVYSFSSLFHAENYSNNYLDPDCYLVSEKNPSYDFRPEYNILLDSALEIEKYNDQIIRWEWDINDYEFQLEKNKKLYDSSLLEDISQNNADVYNSVELKENINDSITRINNLKADISILKQKVDLIRLQNLMGISDFSNVIKIAEKNYRKSYLLYKFYIAILSLIFSITIFAILYKISNHLKSKNSPHTIVFSVSAFAYSLIVLQVFILLIWDIIPEEVIRIILSFLEQFTFFIFALQFLWPIIIIGIFGFMIFKIQKRLYSTENKLKRLLHDKKCPQCGNSIDVNKPFCPLCANKIQVHCNTCSILTPKGLPYCGNCGTKN